MYELISQDYLMHHGVKGMKWGVRHDPERSAQRARVKTAKGELKAARKTFNKSYNRAYGYSARHPFSQYVPGTKANAESNKRWAQATKDLQSQAKVKQNYRKVAGKGADRRDTAGQVAKVVGQSIAIGAAVGMGTLYMTEPGFRRMVNKGLATSLKNTKNGAKRGFDYMTKTRYNKANQIGTLADAAKKGNFRNQAFRTAGSRAEAKAFSYKAMNKNAKKAGRAYGQAMSNGPSSVKEAVGNTGRKVKNAASNTAKSVKTDARYARQGVSATRESASNAVRGAANSASKTAKTAASNVKYKARGASDTVRGNISRRSNKNKFQPLSPSTKVRNNPNVTKAKVGIASGAALGLGGEGALIYNNRKKKRNNK